MLKKISWVFLFLILVGCASNSEIKNNSEASKQHDEFTIPEPDPLETFNRYMYGFNRIADAILLKQLAIAYDLGVPDNAKYCIESFLNNLCAPINTVNYLMQGQGEKTAKTIFRFLLNSTLGLFGLLDFATFVGIEEESTSFNETLASWGVESGPYVMLPLLGPTTFRGMFGYGFDWYFDPVRMVAVRRNGSFNKDARLKKYMWYQYGADVVVKRAKLLPTLDDIYTTSLDSYVTIRSMIFQRQQNVDKKVKSRS